MERGVFLAKVKEEMILERVNCPDALSIYISGSLFDQGLGHAESDIDIYVLLCDEKVAEEPFSVYRRGRSDFHIEYIDQIRLDIEYWTVVKIESILTRLDKCDFQSAHSGFALMPAERKFLNNMLVGKPILHAETFQAWQRKIDPQKLCAAIYWRNYVEWSGLAEDTSGLLASGDGHSAFLTAQQCLDTAVDAALACYGDTNPSAKWRLRKLERLKLSELSERYWTCRTAVLAQEDWETLAARCLQLSNEFILEAQTFEDA